MSLADGLWISYNMVSGRTVMEAACREKRRYVRRHCALPIELRTPAMPFALINETSDLSPGGCYVRLLANFAVGTKVDVVLWAGGTAISFRGTVRTADANVGNGIEFTDITDEQRNRVQSYLDEIKAPLANPDFIFR
jgi:hypothetical protein